MKVLNKKWSEEEFSQKRKEVLEMWPTGKDVDLKEAVNFHKEILDKKNAAIKVQEAKRNGKTYICPSSGTDTIDRHKELLRYIEKEANADFLTTYIDSFTRNIRFEDAKNLLQKAIKTNQAKLNGFPVVIHGVQGSREVIEAVNNPVILFGPTPDVRLTMEIGLAGGHSGYSGGPLISFWNYTKNVPVEKVIHNFQYVNRLMGHYEENGIPMLYCVSGAMPAISPPSLMIVPEIIETLIAAEQGVKHVQLNCWLQGHVAQDLAMISTFDKLAREYLDRFGYTDVKISTYSVCPTGRFPSDTAQVYSLIGFYTMIGVLGKVQVIATRTIDEAHHIPTKEGNALSFKCAKMFIDMLRDQKIDILKNPDIQQEVDIMEKEVRIILDKVLELGDGDPIVGTVKAVENGMLDQPYATTQLVKNKVLGVKDSTGAARFFDFGNLPLTQEIKEFHREKIRDRSNRIGKKIDYETIIQDMTAISNGSILP